MKAYIKFLDNVFIKFGVKQPFWLESKKNNTNRGISNIYILPGTYGPRYITNGFRLASTFYFLKT